MCPGRSRLAPLDQPLHVAERGLLQMQQAEDAAAVQLAEQRIGSSANFFVSSARKPSTTSFSPEGRVASKRISCSRPRPE